MALNNETTDHIKGLLVTVVFHAMVLGALMYVTLSTNPPMFPEPEGVEVNFGTDDTGLGDVEPGPNAVSDESTTVEEQPDITQTSQITESSDGEYSENVLTQDHEDAVVMTDKKVDPNKKLLDEQRKKEFLEQKRIDDEQKRKIADEERIAAEQKHKIDAINARAGRLFGKGSGDGSQGIAGGFGNQGNPNGVANSRNYNGNGGTGNGGGISYSLSGRSAVDLSRPEKGIQASGKVVVAILVDRDGNVIQAYPGVQGSTTTNQMLYEAAQKAAMSTKFNISPNSAERQKGQLTYIFELQ